MPENLNLSLKFNSLIQSKIIIFWVVLIFSCLVYKTSSPGADFDQYSAWLKPILNSDISQLPGKYLSPQGIPYYQWSPGPGGILAIGERVFGGFLKGKDASYAINLIGTLIFIWMMSLLFNHLTKGYLPLVIFGLSILFLGTHAGFYSHSVSSESLSYPFLAVLIFMLVVPRNWTWDDLLITGISCGMLVGIRSHLLIYVAPGILVTVYKALKVWERPLRFNRLFGVFLLIIPFIFKCLEILWLNRWMTGSILKSPYNFGMDDFKSLDLFHPEFFAVLFHPWHGLLIYHPLYGIGFLAVVLGIYFNKEEKRVFFILTAMVLFLNLYICASWYGWWFGNGSFGMRGMAPAAIPVSLAVVWLIVFLKERKYQFIYKTLIGLSFISCLWSYLFLWRDKKPLYNFDELTNFVLENFLYIIPNWVLSLILLGYSLIWVFWRVIPKYKQGLETDHYTEIFSLLILGVMFHYLIFLLFKTSLSWDIFQNVPSIKIQPTLVVINVFAIFSILGSIGVLYIRNFKFNFNFQPLKSFVLWFFLAVFLTTTIQFFLLGVRSKTNISSKATNHLNGRPIEIGEILATYNEYLEVSGFIENKRRLYNFLKNMGVDSKQLTPPH